MGLLGVHGLEVEVGDGTRRGRALRGVNMTIEAGEILGIVGETGAGKSLTAKAVLGLLPFNARATAGQIRFRDAVVDAREWHTRVSRGRDMTMIFQQPKESLNPVIRVGVQLERVLRYRKDRAGRRSEARSLLASLGFSDPDRILSSYPHELSGGMAQRVVIALAFASGAELLFADEPATGLDLATQTRLVLELSRHVRDRGKTLVIITHDIGLAQEFCDRLVVMYAGRVVEEGLAGTVICQPMHPYTRGLVRAAGLSGDRADHRFMPGMPPSPLEQISGCAFASRCEVRMDICEVVAPKAVRAGNQAAECHLYD